MREKRVFTGKPGLHITASLWSTKKDPFISSSRTGILLLNIIYISGNMVEIQIRVTRWKTVRFRKYGIMDKIVGKSR
jgi:hypothetical protein